MDPRGIGLALVALWLCVSLGGCAAPTTYLGPEDDAADGAPADAGPEAPPADAGPEAPPADAGPEATPDSTRPDAQAPADVLDGGPADGSSVSDGGDDRPEVRLPDGPCGVPGGACCGALCGAGATCAEGRCVACGGEGSPCCGVLCGAGLECVASVCRVACPVGTGRCEGRCIDLRADDANCGGCGRACAADSACEGGVCVPRCAVPLLFCATSGPGRCVQAQTDAANCGACGRACAPVEVCAAGRCRPPFRGVAEDFEGAPFSSWVPTVRRVYPPDPITPLRNSVCAHDGAYGAAESDTFVVRPDLVVGRTGERLSAWVRLATGGHGVYLGVAAADHSGGWLVEPGAGGTELVVNRAPGWYREGVAVRRGAPYRDGWYRMEIEFSGTRWIARLYEPDGVTVRLQADVDLPEFVPGPLALGVSDACVDTVTVTGP